MKKTLSLVLAGTLCLALSTGALAAFGFSDVPDGKWYTAEIGEMTAAGYIDGYEDGTFRPDDDVSVAEFVTITAPGTVTAVYELPCTSWFPGTDANAVVGTSDGRWYFVELSGRNNDCVPELIELTALSGKSVSSLRWCTTSRDDDGVLFSGRDYIVAALADGSELIAFEH